MSIISSGVRRALIRWARLGWIRPLSRNRCNCEGYLNRINYRACNIWQLSTFSSSRARIMTMVCLVRLRTIRLSNVLRVAHKRQTSILNLFLWRDTYLQIRASYIFIEVCLIILDLRIDNSYLYGQDDTDLIEMALLSVFPSKVR